MFKKFSWKQGLAAVAVLAIAGTAAAQMPMMHGGMSEPGAGPSPEQRAQMMDMHLNRMAERLEIKASQEAAWQDYVAAHKAMFGARPDEKPAATDAAALVRAHADRAAQMAAKLGKLADATAKLEAVLTPPQRRVLDGMAQAMASRHHHHGAPHCGGEFAHEHGPGFEHDHEHGPDHGPRMD